jgi:putative transcriptional regulator
MSMQGHLLIAHPLLNDGFFNRSVVYLTNHSDMGTVGFALNFKTQFLLRDMRPKVKNGNFPIYEGGPVSKEQLLYVHRLGGDISDAFHVKNDIYVGGNFEELLTLIDRGKVKPCQVKFFAGYSGWEEHQLENEIKNKHWMSHNPDNSDFFGNEAEDLWGLQLTEIKNSYSIFSDFTYDPSSN